MDKKNSQTEKPATAKQVRAFGAIRGCYPMGKGVGLVKDEKTDAVKAKANAEGYTMKPLIGCGRDYNFGGSLYTFCKQAEA